MAKPLSEYLYKPEDECVQELLHALPWDEGRARKVTAEAAALIESVRKGKKKSSDMETFFQHYGLDTQEGLALMCMAEALLRIPDKQTANALIRDKVAAINWLKSGAKNKDWLALAAGLGLSLTGATMNSLFSRLGEPVIRAAMMQAMKVLGKQFVVGETIGDALREAGKEHNAPYRMSYDMLGEGARTAADSQRYFEEYTNAIKEIATHSAGAGRMPGISVKLSALYPRYEFAQEERCIPAMAEKIISLSDLAANSNISLTVDAEEVDRLETSLKIIGKTVQHLSARATTWPGFGMAVQAYQKRALPLIDHVAEMAAPLRGGMQVRLVKGAYWDAEVKRAQVQGYPDYSVYTRKVNSDLSYMACAHTMLQHEGRIHPLFGTHNAHTIMAIVELTKAGRKDFEFQKLYGMGNALYERFLETGLANVSTYAPVGSHQDLLPYLVRRLLENGANSSFVRMIYDEGVEAERLATDPVQRARQNNSKSNPKIVKPADLFQPQRVNSKGLNLSDAGTVEALSRDMQRFIGMQHFAAPFVAGKMDKGDSGTDVFNPARTGVKVGRVVFAGEGHVDKAFAAAKTGQQIWGNVTALRRAEIISRFAEKLEDNRAELMALCVKEAGKTLPDARDEIREAVDFCRYYAALGRTMFAEGGTALPGPTGESNILKYEGRGIFVCISPWNFPLAIFTGQVVAALMAGNAVIAKPAEQTPLIAMRAVELMLEAGVPREAITLLPGDGHFGALLVQHKDVAGVAFTGSEAAARSINRTLAAKEGPIAKLIAETGGQNAFIADSSALPEQVVDDLIRSAFNAAGQRCSAARVLFVQEDAAERILKVLSGAMELLHLGDPAKLSTDIGPVIDAQALAALKRHKMRLDGFGRKIAETPLADSLKNEGYFFAPCVYEIDALSTLEGEVFGPILHVIRFAQKDLPDVIAAINASGYGLTLGIHSRIEKTIEKITAQVKAGNVYVNRSMIGAVVGVQPFGGRGLSGTGPKAGGPDYLHAFATEKAVSTDITASGGNTSLVMLGE